jgi:lipopolysaccharide/colanic/teichoic acid biosynthesis glycosyltransferase
MNARTRGTGAVFEGSAKGPTVRSAGPRRERFYRRSGKRMLDVGLVMLVLPFVLPVMAILAFVVARDGRSPFYLQERIGRGGRIFTLWKLRTMVPDAKTRLALYLSSNEAARLEWDAYQKLTCDPRITRIGHFLRKSSLDELPQLLNVLKGDMSLVGPRPMMPEQRHLYPGQAYYTLLPGLTGLWQVSDRNASTFVERAEFDQTYEANLSLSTDLRVMLATLGVVLRGTGR